MFARSFRRATLAMGAALLALPAVAHEFWIEPVEYSVPAGADLIADIRVGETFEGAAYSYIPPNFTRFDIVMGDAVTEVAGRAGDRPALQMEAPEEGLAIVVHQTKAYKLVYDSFAKFENFVTHKDATWALARFEERGLDPENVRESYTRYGKSLIAVGDGAGSDREVGLLTEIVALANPYTDPLADGLPVRVLYDGAPRAETQVELFARSADGSVEVTTHRTDAEGVAVLPATPGTEYLADAVVIREIEAEAETDPTWESLWASLTYKIPAE
ncbi:Nickel uptake substrate-specific transmembrane region [Roseivivax sp. THAF40]|uniref:DUF4198 domain-containing protein n=1 Tax=unclassified Roseivivax TaxID=2639302 RepID=UPI0012678B85|nr:MULTISPECIES: DUF4198 domain-containing protein [unclassified Roseivivax]QFS81593.1 Nickel uptake substrate-specific transmembrane region [Roseivivax sp. THAF197b]QFT45322.1 Nickel uptake substrate-specific transmembrane region [Roseivivax sp. THAF40]